MPSTIPDAAIAAVMPRLAEQIPTAALERDRRAPIDLDTESLPRLVVTCTGLEPDTGQEPGYTHYTVTLAVTGYAKAGDDTPAAQAVYALHAAVVAALAGWTPDTAGLGDLAEGAADFALYDAEDSADPAGEFTATFTLLAVTATGSPTL